MEHFPPADYDMVVNRRILIEDNGSIADEALASRAMEEYFAEEEFEEGTEDEFAGVDLSKVMIIGDVVEGEDVEDFSYYYEDGEPLPDSKQYARHADSITLEGNSLTGEEGVGVYDHSERNLASCGENEGDLKIILKTDKYGYETKWAILKSDGSIYAEGPPLNTNY